ncbi:Pyrimidine-specific ribonucleoside hydrolase RihA [subsurface metagenome]
MSEKKYRVLIDTDPGLGKKGADVDDGLALFFMFNNPEIFEIEGITTVFGNTRVKIGYSLLKKYLEVVGRTEIPYKMGARSKRELGKLNEASSFIIEMVKEYPNELILITLGPLTNISTAFKHYSELFDDLKKIVFMGGLLEPLDIFDSNSLDTGGLFKTTEFNFFMDPLATQLFIEIDTSTPRIGMGLDICCKAVFQEKHLSKIKTVNKPIPQFVVEDVSYWLELWKLRNMNGFYPFDTMVPIYLLKPDLFVSKDVFLKVDTDETLGKLTILDDIKKNSAPIKYCMDFKESTGPEQFMDVLISNLIK